MRFCMITTFYPPFNFGGDGVFVQQLSNELAKRGHHVDVIHCADAYRLLAGKKPVAEGHDHPRVKVHRLTSPFGLLSPLTTQQTGFPLFKSSFLKQILSTPFDVIHYNNISLVGGPQILEYGRGIKLYTLQEYWLVCPTHMLFKFNREACSHRQCFSCTLTHRRPPQLWRYTNLIQQSLQHVDLFLAPTAFVRDKHLEMGLNIPVAELPHFTSRWQPGEVTASSAPATPYFLFVGRLVKLKGLQTIIPVFRRYSKAQLWIVGTGAHEPVLRRMAAGSPHIKFLGYQSGEQLRILYEQAVAAIVPSLWYEVFGIVILEAFAQGTPVIVRNIGGMPQIIEQSGGGFTFETEDELLRAMDRLLEDSDLRQTLGRQGREAVRQRWCADVHIARYLELIEQVSMTRSRTYAATAL